MGKIPFAQYPYLMTIGGVRTMPDEGFEDFACKGWGAMLKEMFDKVNTVLDEHGVSRNTLKIQQIKEKFGELRIYYCMEFEPLTDEDTQDSVEDLVADIIESTSDTTRHKCCICGAEASYLSQGWVLPYCEDCAIADHKAANERHKTNFEFDKCWTKISE